MATCLLHVKTRQCWERGWGLGHDTHLNNSIFIRFTGRLCGAGTHEDRPAAPQVRSPLRGGGPQAPAAPAPPGPRPQELLPLTGPLGHGCARDPRPGPQTPSTVLLRSSGSPWWLSASRWSPGLPRLSELRRWPRDRPGDGAGQRAPRLRPRRLIWAWLVPTADLDSVLVREIGGHRPAKHGLPWTAT